MLVLRCERFYQNTEPRTCLPGRLMLLITIRQAARQVPNTCIERSRSAEPGTRNTEHRTRNAEQQIQNMRLSQDQQKIIISTARKHFGSNVHVRLFGSRVNDKKKGGDIDLLIRADNKKMVLSNKILFLVELKIQLGERKIDVVFEKPGLKSEFFIKSIVKMSIPL